MDVAPTRLVEGATVHSKIEYRSTERVQAARHRGHASGGIKDNKKGNKKCGKKGGKKGGGKAANKPQE